MHCNTIRSIHSCAWTGLSSFTVVLFASFALPGSALAQSEEAELATARLAGRWGAPVTESSKQMVSFREQLFSAHQDTTPKLRWRERFESANSRRKRGILYGVAGLGAAAVASSVGISSGSVPVYTLGGLAGSALAVYGLVTWIDGEGDVDELEREGRLKGYISFFPHQDQGAVEVGFAYALRF